MLALGTRKICSRFVIHSLFDEQNETRLHAAQDFIDTCDEDSTFLQTISSQTQGMKAGATSVSRLQKSRIKTFLIAFFDSNGMAC